MKFLPTRLTRPALALGFSLFTVLGAFGTAAPAAGEVLHVDLDVTGYLCGL